MVERATGSSLATRARWLAGLTWELTLREIQGRYRGAKIGLLWSLITPFFMLAVYTLAFGFVLKGRWPGVDDSLAGFALVLFIGLSTHSFFAECFNRAPGLVVGNANLVKKVVFPLRILPWSVAGSALFHFLLNILALVVIQLFMGKWPGVWLLTLPLIMLPLLIFTVGTVLVVSAVSVYLRDVGQFVGIFSTAMLFLSSAIVPIDMAPETIRWVFNINPLTPVIDALRAVLIFERSPDWLALVNLGLFSIIMLRVGELFFEKLRRGFGDVL